MMPKNLLIKSILLNLLVFFVASNTSSEVRKELIVGVQDFTEYLPYSTYSNDLGYQGFNREVFNLFERYYPYKFKYRAYPVKRLYNAFLKGLVDLKYPDNPYWSASNKKGFNIIYSLPLVSFIDGVFVHPDRASRGLRSMKVLGTIRGFTPYPYKSLINSGAIQLKEANGYQGLFLMVLKQRIDGAYFNVDVGMHYMKEYLDDPYALIFNKKLPYKEVGRHLSTIKFSGVLKDFDEFIKNHQDEISSLKNKFFVQSIIK